MSTDSEKIKSIVHKYGCNTDSLISILQDIQTEYLYLPESSLSDVADLLDLPKIQVYAVATFFKAFSLKPKGKHIVNVCLGTACHVRGAPAVLDELKRELGIEPGETTKDMQFTLETVNCVGSCALGPVIVVDGKYYGKMNTEKVRKIFKEYRKISGDKKHEKIAVSG